jgi:Zn-dependent peptidase ImmA (M78 family)
MQNNDVPFGPRKKAAKTLAQKLIKAAAIIAPPVSLQKVIEHLQTTHSLQVRRIVASDKVSGLLVVCREIDDEYTTIGFNGAQPWCRRRFTIAHEIGHLLFGHACTKNQSDGSHDESEANIFAGELLVPTAFIKKDFLRLRDIQELSKLYRVSDQALTIKLMDTRLV